MTTFARALVGILPAWRRLGRPDLPLWAFLGPRPRLQRVEMLRAELRCEMCDLQAHCKRRIAAGAFTPPKSCPNADLFA